MILFLYNVALMLVFVLGSPWWLLRIATTQKYRQGLLERIGFIRPLQGGNDGGQNGRPLIWIHAVSVGEVLAVSRLVKNLDALLPDHFIAISTTTQAGQQLARDRFGQARVFYCPLDLPWAVSGCIDARKPVVLILAETEFWPNLLSGCYKRNIPVAVVNARVSDRSWPRYQRLRALWKPFLSQLSLVLAQSELDANRLGALGVLPEKLAVIGNLKFDIRTDRESDASKVLSGQMGDLRLIVAGSTLDGEESLLLSAWPEILQADPNLALVLAPRHPERFSAVASLIRQSMSPWRKRSAIGTLALRPGEIVLLDSIGELASVYSIATIAFVGGSLIPAGGHNPLEPAQFGKPILMGEHYNNFRFIVEQLRSQRAIQLIAPGQLATAVAALLLDDKYALDMGERARQAFEQQSGATDRTAKAITTLLASRRDSIQGEPDLGSPGRGKPDSIQDKPERGRP